MKRISIPISSINWIGHIEKWPNKTALDWNESRVNLFNSHTKWARAIGLKIFGMYKVDGAEVNDYVNFANMGLLESIDSYEPNNGATFRYFAFKRIKGSILNGIVKYSEHSQTTDWIRKRMKERMHSISKTHPENDEVELVENIIALTIGFVLDNNSYMVSEMQLTDAYFDSQELVVLQQNVRRIVENLPNNQRDVMEKHYYQLKSFSEVAKDRSCSVGRISQLHAQAINNIRKKLKWE
ncbi:sigma-70 family RNA polymerase sigma factor [Agaribacter flavus]|uniref:Sigma-70 family RNA polymerase sigma factor n=1 Tax=Agaribacter flavus TaxID=1902781 RepID=A0ABV7FQP0_9ALTE